MVRKSTQKTDSRSAKSTGKKDAKKRKLKTGLFFAIVGDVRFFIMNVSKKGKMDQTEISPQAVVDCVMYVLKSDLQLKNGEKTNENLPSQTSTSNGSNPSDSSRNLDNPKTRQSNL